MVLSSQLHFLETGERMPGDRETFLLLRNPARVRNLWRAVKTEVLAAWIREHPCSRPAAWWECDGSPEAVEGWPEFRSAQRRRIGGIGEPQHDRIAVVPRFDRGIPVGWFDEAGAALFGGIAVSEADPPRFEAEAEYLRRHNLLTPAELTHLVDHPELLTPEVVTFDDDGGDG